MPTLRPHIVILGAGFGGVYVAKRLAKYVKRGKIDVTIVNKTNYFLFTPLLHEVATGSLTPTSIAEPLREAFAQTGIELCQGSVESIDLANQRVHISGQGRHTLPYDYVVIATGAETNYYDIPGADRFGLPLKDLADAARIRDRIIDSFEEAIMTEDPNERKRLLSFAVVGGGPSGVETAAELSEFAHGIIDRYYCLTHACEHEEVRVSLIHTGHELLPRFSPHLRQSAEKRLRDTGIHLHLDSAVTGVTAHGLMLAKNELVPAGTVIWTAGVKPLIPRFEGGQPALVAGRLSVDRFFHIEGEERAFALGDVAGYIDPRVKKGAANSVQGTGKSQGLKIDPQTAPSTLPPAPLPLLAQVAVNEAGRVAKNILASINDKPLKEFHYHPLGSLVSVGQWFAVGEIFFLNITGRLTWLIWRIVYLFKFASWKKRIRIAFEWTLDIFYPRDVTKLT